jgi:hypothetical protein
MADQPPARSLVEFRFIYDLLGFRGASRWGRQITQFFGQMGGEQLAVDQESESARVSCRLVCL